jgi:alkylation response protein AidB-like acyl-CoA dehydrogenase
MNDQVRTTPAAKRESEFTTPVGRRIRDAVSELVPLLRKNAVASEHNGALVQESLAALQATGLFTASLPKEFGGHALGARDMAEIVVQVGRGDGSAGWTTMISSAHSRIVLSLPDKTTAEVYRDATNWLGPRLAAGSLFSEKIQKGEQVPGGFIVKGGGKWLFASGCKHAAFVAVGIDFIDGKGHKRRGIAVLEKGQYDIVDDWHVMGLRASSSNSVATKEDVFVPEHRFLDLTEFPDRLATIRTRYKGLGFQLDPLGLMLLPGLEMVCTVLGMAKGGLECFIEQAKKRKPFNLPYKTVAESAVTQASLAKAAAMIEAAETLLMAQADLVDQRAMGDGNFLPIEESKAMMSIAYVGNLCDEALSILQNTLGSSTVSDENPIQRYVRDTRVALSQGALRFEPTAEIYGRQLLGFGPFAALNAATPGITAAKAEQQQQA